MVSFPKADSERSTVVLMDRSMEADETFTVLLIPNLTCPFGTTLPDVNMDRGALQELMIKPIIIRNEKRAIGFICIM